MNIKNSSRRLCRFYGDVARRQNECIISLITGRSILDIGCGYGLLIEQLKRRHPSKEVTGIDLDDESIKIARDNYGLDVRRMSAYDMDFPDGSFDTVVLRETIHHFDSDEKLETAVREIYRVASKELIIFDPNPNWIVKVSRMLIRHKDPEASPERVKAALRKAGFKVSSCAFRDVAAFPLSGGFVGLEFVPNVGVIKRMVLAADGVVARAVSFVGLGRYLCWRYLIRAVK